MQRDFGVAFVTQCAPVMAGLKPANLFRWVELDASAMEALVCHWHTLLRPRGLAVEILSRDTANHAFLVYVYRAPRLQAILKAPEIYTYLSEVGYPQPEDFRAALQHLSARLAQGEPSPMKSVSFSAIRWRMWLVSCATRERTTPLKGTGKRTATRLPPRRALRVFASVPMFTCDATATERRLPG